MAVNNIDIFASQGGYVLMIGGAASHLELAVTKRGVIEILVRPAENGDLMIPREGSG